MAYLTATQVRTRVGRTASIDVLDGYADEDLDELVAEFTQVAEDYLGIAWEPTTVTEVVDVTAPTPSIVLAHRKVRSVTSVTVDGIVQAATSYRVDKLAGIIHRTAGSLFDPRLPPTVVYVHGEDAPNAAVKRACALYVQCVVEAEKSGTSRNLLSQGIDGGTTRYSTPSKVDGRPTGWLEVDRMLNTLRPDLPGVA